MDYKYKYLKYKNKYIALKKQYAGENSIILPNRIIKGPSYMCHLNLEDKNIYLFGEIHKNLTDIICSNNGWKTMLEWLNKDIIPKYKDDYNRINKANLKYPIIMDIKGNIFDGVHRYIKSKLLNKKSIKAYIFSIDFMNKMSS
jgi:hypothetical protein